MNSFHWPALPCRPEGADNLITDRNGHVVAKVTGSLTAHQMARILNHLPSLVAILLEIEELVPHPRSTEPISAALRDAITRATAVRIAAAPWP